jgi:SAM-dependent methyltransferase
LNSAVASINGRVWRTRNFVRAYTGRVLRPAEVMVLVRHRELFTGRVLELGSGAGRVSGYLIDLASSYCGIDLSPRMVEHGRAHYPDGTFEVRDLRDLVTFADGAFDLVFAGYNVLDVLDDVERRGVLGEIHRILARDGALVMSSHNRAASAARSSPGRVELTPNPLRLAYRVVGAAASVRNRRRLARFEHEEASHAIRNDAAHWYRLLHYYIGRDEQELQLGEVGFRLLDCLDEDGKAVPTGEPAADSSELHYVALRLSTP